MRKIILAVLGLLTIAGAVLLGNYLVKKNKKPVPKFKKAIKTVFVKPVINKEVPIVISVSGNLIAKNKIALFSEVQGVLKPTNNAFKIGTVFNKGEVLLSVDSNEFYAGLQSQKNNLYNLITGVLPDIRLDYPLEFKKWDTYLRAFSMDKVVAKLPEFSSTKEKYFISGRGVLSAYYNVKNLEARLVKYKIRAPFKGVLTETLVTTGSLVRAGQKLGEFIDTSVYEMEVAMNIKFADLLKKGNIVELTNLEKTKSYKGKVVRVNGKVDQVSQTIKVYIDVAHKDLKEGMFLEANILAKSIPNTTEVSRKLLVDNTGLYTVKHDSILTLTKVTPVYFGENTVVVKGLKNNDKIITQTLPGAFNGMIVNIDKNNK